MSTKPSTLRYLPNKLASLLFKKWSWIVTAFLSLSTERFLINTSVKSHSLSDAQDDDFWVDADGLILYFDIWINRNRVRKKAWLWNCEIIL